MYPATSTHKSADQVWVASEWDHLTSDKAMVGPHAALVAAAPLLKRGAVEKPWGGK